MLVLRADGAAETPAIPRSAVTVGTFDGVHRGHRSLIDLTHRQARRRGLPTTVVTFDRHPLAVVRPASCPAVLMTLDQKLAALEVSGLVDHVVVVPFDPQRSRQPAASFFREILAGVARAELIVVGPDFHFGRNQEGDIAVLRSLADRAGIEVLRAPMLAFESGIRYSSTLVRRLVAGGDLVSARVVLGRPFELAGELTGADLQTQPGQCLPAAGLYDAAAVTPGGAPLDVVLRVPETADERIRVLGSALPPAGDVRFLLRSNALAAQAFEPSIAFQGWMRRSATTPFSV